MSSPADRMNPEYEADRHRDDVFSDTQRYSFRGCLGYNRKNSPATGVL